MNQSSTTDPIGEQLSALMDGELPPDQLRFLLRRVDADAALPLRWSRYHAARAALRRQGTAQLRADFAEVLMQRLGEEAAPAAPRAGRVLRWLGGGAIAASVAIVALVVTRPALQEPAGTLVVAAPPATAPLGVMSAPAVVAPSPVPTFGPGLFGPAADVAPAAWEVPYGRTPYGGVSNPYLMSRGTPLLAPVQTKPAEPAPQP